MSFFLPLAISLGICLVPVWLLRRAKPTRTLDYFIASRPTPPDVLRNSLLVYFLRIATFGLFFAWGANGDFLPAAIIAVCIGLGIYLVSLLREPLIEFIDGALSTDASATPPSFLAKQYGNDARIRLLAAGLALAALIALITAEAFAIATLAKPLVGESAGSVYLLAAGMVVLAALYTVISGNSGVMHSAQLQLGIVYFGLFGSVALLLYFIVSDASPTPPQAKAAIVFVAAAGTLIMFYRRSKYVETAQIGSSDVTGESSRTSLVARLLSRLEKILNPFISAIVVFVVVLTAMEIFSVGLSAMARDSFAALRMGTQTSGMTLGGLAVLALLYPLVDARTWQTLAAAAKDTQSDRVLRSATLERVFHSAAVELPLVWLLISMLGTLAALLTERTAGGEALATFIAWLIAEQGGPADFVLSFLLVGMFAMALSAMSSMLSAVLWLLRYDVVPAFWADPVSPSRRAILVGVGLCIISILLVAVAGRFPGLTFTSSNFLMLLIGCCCAQLAFAPLLLPTLLAPTTSMQVRISAPWAAGALVAAAATGIAAVAVYAATGTEAWLWAAMPACVGAGTVFLLIGHLLRRA
jgi:hypothetical protein